jgi:NADH-quinone oxidoreductase subunit J
VNLIENLHLFFIFLLIFCSILLFVSKNPVYAVLFLIVIFFISACTLILFNVDFISILFVIIYVGAIAVLFMFIVMMLDLKTNNFSSFDLYIFTPLTVFIVLNLQIFFFYNNSVFIFDKKFDLQRFSSCILTDSFSNIEIFGQCLYNYYIICFLLAGLVLLVAMLGAILLTSSYRSIRSTEFVPRQLSRSNFFLSFFN